MIEGLLYKALSGFYTVLTDEGEFVCRARGKFRKEGASPLVGDRVQITPDASGNGVVEAILPRRNSFIRPNVANIDRMVIIASAAIPVTDPFLIDRIAAIAVLCDCEPILCINKCDLDSAAELFAVYKDSGFTVIRCSAETGEGIDELRAILMGKTSVFTGNSGVGKSSILNRISDDFAIKTAEVSEKLGRGRHTTRHIELYRLDENTFIGDTPGFSSFDTDILSEDNAAELVRAYREFAPYTDDCQFMDCTHTKERGCGVIEAVRSGKISRTRHENYVRLHDMAMTVKSWELKK